LANVLSIHSLSTIQGFSTAQPRFQAFTAWPYPKILTRLAKIAKVLHSMVEVVSILRNLNSIQGYLTAWPRVFFKTQAIFKVTSQPG
jgi:hypothetical protein